MSGWTLFFVTVGITYCVELMFRLIDAIEKD